MQVKDSRGKTCDQDVSRLVVGSGCQVVKIPLLVEEVSAKVEVTGEKEGYFSSSEYFDILSHHLVLVFIFLG